MSPPLHLNTPGCTAHLNGAGSQYAVLSCGWPAPHLALTARQRMRQADFSFFFDAGGRRRCYIAPERFYESAGADAVLLASQPLEPAMARPASCVKFSGSGQGPMPACRALCIWQSGVHVVCCPSGRLLHTQLRGPCTAACGSSKPIWVLALSQDVFSMGCVLAELFLDGKELFNLSQVMHQGARSASVCQPCFTETCTELVGRALMSRICKRSHRVAAVAVDACVPERRRLVQTCHCIVCSRDKLLLWCSCWRSGAASTARSQRWRPWTRPSASSCCT